MTALVSVCAWCRPNYAPPGVLVTHTICRAHRDEQIASLGSPDAAQIPAREGRRSSLLRTLSTGEPLSTRRLVRAPVERSHSRSGGTPETGASGSSCSSGEGADCNGPQATAEGSAIGLASPEGRALHRVAVGSIPARPTNTHLDPSSSDGGADHGPLRGLASGDAVRPGISAASAKIGDGSPHYYDPTCSTVEFGEDGLSDTNRDKSDVMLVVVGALILVMGAFLLGYFLFGGA